MAGLFDKHGIWHEKEEDVEGIFEDYFHNIFTSSRPSITNIHEVLQHVRYVISDDYCNQALMIPFTKDEIYVALQQVHPCRAPIPDGMLVIFYHRFWHVIGDDV